jgi:type II secretory pathway pseudopilin PulG
MMFDNKKNSPSRSHGGFTLIELLVFIAIFTLIIGSFIAILVSTINVQTKQVAISEVEQQGQFLTQQLQYYVQSARLVDMAIDSPTSTLRLQVSTSSLSPTIILMSTGTVYLQQGLTGGLQPLTSNRVVVTNLLFTRHYNLNSTSGAIGTDSLSYSFTITNGNATSTASSEVFQSSITVLQPVNKIALIQQGKGESNSASVSSIVTAYPSNNESGDLLIAVVANNGLVTSSISDTEGNSWIMVASTTYSSASDKLTVYAATNARAGANTTTLTFASGASYASIFLYEYRGAALSGSFDKWAAQVQTSTAMPTSGFVYPTSTAELLLGIDYNANTNEVPSAGSGFTLETSSTVNNTTQVFVEDQNQFISGAVAAPWKYTGTPNSTAMIVTFK